MQSKDVPRYLRQAREEVILALSAPNAEEECGHRRRAGQFMSEVVRTVHSAPALDCDWSLLRAAVAAAEKTTSPLHVGGIYSSDVFYDERPDLNEQMTRHGILAVEMEAAELYNLAARHSVRALAVLTVSDHLITGDALPADQREQSFGDMIEIALAAAFPDGG